MGDFIIGFACACICAPLAFGLIYINTKSYKSKDTAFIRYMVMDDLWLRTGSTRTLNFAYADSLVDVVVKCNSLRGTNGDVKVYDAYINDIICATCVKTWDGENSYYGFYINEEFDEKEVWDILDIAHKRAKEQREQENAEKKINKKSILKGTNNESI